MKVSGIVRRLDGLGRVVLPREYRKMHHINIGDPLEILSNDSGEIIIKKVDETEALRNLLTPAVIELEKAAGTSVVCFSRYECVAACGERTIGMLKKETPVQIRNLIDDKKTYCGDGRAVGLDVPFIYMATIMGEIDFFGGLIVVSDNPITEKVQDNVKLVALIAGRALQKY